MPRKPPPPHRRGMPRTAGSGRKRGTPNRKTVELRMLMGAMAGDIDYQRKLRSDFTRRRLHPTTELRVWEYVLGRPTEQIELSANVTTNQRLTLERDMLRQLDLAQLEALAAESQGMIDRAFAAVLAKPGIPDRIGVRSSSPIPHPEAAHTRNDASAGQHAPSSNPHVDAEPERVSAMG